MNCRFDSLAKGSPCKNHGCIRKLAMSFTTHPQCECKGPPGWGDRIAAWLAPRGITKAGYRRWKVRWGFADACNCPERQEGINAVGRWVAKWRKRLAAIRHSRSEDSPQSRPGLSRDHKTESDSQS
jgi:hypothetical protein